MYKDSVTEKELIGKIKKLGQIKPSPDWVALTKNQILGQEKITAEVKPLHFPILRLAYVGLLFAFVLFGFFCFSQNSLPGELLYPIKKITEKSRVIFVSKEELPKVQLQLANKRVEELNKIAQTNQVQKLAPAIREVQTSVSQASENLAKSEKVDKETVDKIVNLKKNLKKVETTLGTKIGSKEDEQSIQNWTKEQTEMLIKDLEKRTLNKNQEKILAQMKELVKKEKYSEALELYLVNQ